MAHSIEDYLRVATSTRQDFEADLVTYEDLLSAALDANQEWLASSLSCWDRPAFPIRYCEYASVVLKQRLGTGRLIEGGYRTDPESNFDEWHMFLDVGSTTLDANTIIDITADQFSGGEPVYVGPLVLPWAKVPNLNFEGQDLEGDT